jgi:UDP-GlcNAc:undecaprenyl-phosphate GlcNAc-1-phosphate transferase
MLFLFLPLLDTVVVVLRRLLKRKNPISSPGTDHIHHRLIARGVSPTRTVIILLGVTLAANIVAMAVQGMSVLVIVVTTLGIVLLLGLVAWRRRRAFRRASARQPAASLAVEPAGGAADPPETAPADKAPPK